MVDRTTTNELRRTRSIVAGDFGGPLSVSGGKTIVYRSPLLREAEETVVWEGAIVESNTFH
jgi:hypothetical protein